MTSGAGLGGNTSGPISKICYLERANILLAPVEHLNDGHPDNPFLRASIFLDMKNYGVRAQPYGYEYAMYFLAEE